MSVLEIPERALTVACDVYDAALCSDVQSDTEPVRECAEKLAVRAAAPIIVASELRQMAKMFWDQDDLGPARWCVRRANELDPEGTTAQ